MTNPAIITGEEKKKTPQTEEVAGYESGDYDKADDLGLIMVGDDTDSVEKTIS